MKKHIVLKKLKLTNFKGIKSLEIDFKQQTSIFGNNGTGKTTLFDAFTFVLFGKDSEGKAVFGIKTKDQNGNVIHKLEHSVEAVLDIDGEVTTIKRLVKEKWVKKRGSLEAEYTGDATEYFWNDVPKKQKEFQEKIGDILSEDLFKLITNPLAFNSLNWKDERDILINLAGEISNDELIAVNPDFSKLLESLSNKSLKEFKDEKSFKRKKLNKDIKDIPTRIDEVYRNMPEKQDYKKLDEEKSVLQKRLSNLESQLEDKSKAYEEKLDEKNKWSTKVFELEQLRNKISFEVKNEISNELSKGNNDLERVSIQVDGKKHNLKYLKDGLNSVKSNLDSLNTRKENILANIESKRNEWEVENAKELNFDEDLFACPSCKRKLEADDIEKEKEKMIYDFKKDKTASLITIQKEGIALSNESKTISEEINTAKDRVKKGEDKISEVEIELKELEALLDKLKKDESNEVDREMELSKRLSVRKDYIDAEAEINRLDALISKEIVIDNDEIKKEVSEVKLNIEGLNKQLATKVLIEDAEKRISELNKREKELAQQISDVEKEQFLIENFEKAKANLIEAKVNSKFEIVNFKLFETQINGSEVPCCIAQINGVPFSDANTASKINAGVDIINTLSENYGVTAPIFIDNRESVVKLIDSDSQIINLIVSEKDTELRTN